MKVLVVDDERKMGVILKDALEEDGHEVTTREKSAEAARLLEREPFDLLLTDLKMAPPDGLELLRLARASRPDMAVILMTAYATAQTAVQAMRAGASDYLIKPFELDELRLRVRKLERERRLGEDVRLLQQENELLKKETGASLRMDRMIGKSAAMRDVFELAEKVAGTEATVLVRGESGTGKSLLARAIHGASPRSGGPFITVNCGALPENLLESELFGHEKGAFTGATSSRQGRFEYANGGTILLDEVGDMPLATQVKLLRVLEQNEIVRVGSNAPIHVDVRILAATHRRLEDLVKEGKFREDLYFRLKVVTVTIPPLRERKDDIPLLAEHFIRELSAQHEKPISGLSPQARQRLTQYDWPGNVRELRNCIEHMVVVTTDPILDLDDLPDHIAPGEVPPATATQLVGMSLQEAERGLIKNTLAAVGGTVAGDRAWPNGDTRR